MANPRVVAQIHAAQPTSDGAGVKLMRVLGNGFIRHLDPFLLLDAFSTDDPQDYLAGFPSHPHRGFETVTYMLEGSMQHKDSVGNTGNLVAGSVQWMTAGRGIIHSEMPQQVDGRMAGFQLWVNLPSAKKMIAPRYQDIPPEQIPVVSRAPGVEVKVIAGTVDDAVGPVGGVDVEPVMLDVRLHAGASTTLSLPQGHTAFLYIFEGAVGVAQQELVDKQHIVVLTRGDEVTLTAGPAGGRTLLIAGQPLQEPIVQYGPFVMNTKEEIAQAITDYQSGRFAT